MDSDVIILSEMSDSAMLSSILSILFALYISYRIAKRKAGDDKVGCIAFAYVSVVYLLLCFFSFVLITSSSSGLYEIATYDSYEATIIDVSSYMKKNSDGIHIKMYTPTIEFTPNGSSEPRTIKLKIGSGKPYQIGEKHDVVYNSDTGKIVSREIRLILLMIAALITSLMLLSLVVYGVYYAFVKKRTFPLTSLLTILFIYITLPIGMIGMNAGLINYVYNRLVYGIRSEQSIFVLIFIIFNIIVLSLVIIALAKMFIRKEKIKIHSSWHI